MQTYLNSKYQFLKLGCDSIEKDKNSVELIIKRIEDLRNKSNNIKNKKVTPYRISKNGAMNPRTLNNFLNRTRKDPRFSTIEKICKGLDVTIREFFDDDLFD